MSTQDAAVPLDAVSFRAVTSADVAAMTACRLSDPAAGPADERMSAYFNGQHHPQRALMPRIGYVAVDDDIVISYIAGHLTTRHDCAGEAQYLFVTPAHRRRRIATELLRLLAVWFKQHDARRVCVCLDTESPEAKPFYESLGAAPLSPLRKYWYLWEDIEVQLGRAWVHE